MNRGSLRRILSGILSLVMVGLLWAPALQAQPYQYYQQGYNGSYQGGYNGGSWDARGRASDGRELGRSLGGSVGMAAGFVGGAAIAAAVLKASVFATMGPLVPLLVGTAITLAGGFLGAKFLSKGGEWLTSKLGKQNTWMMIGSMIGTIAAIALIPTLGPFAGAGGLIVKGLIGGLAGGILGRLFANQLETLATPRMLMAGMGAVLGGLAGNIPGAIAGLAGGYAMGAIFDDHFFSKPGDSIKNYLPDFSGITNSLRNAGSRIGDWANGVGDNLQDRWNEDYYANQYGSSGGYHYYQDPYYQTGYQYARGPDPYYDQPFAPSYSYQAGDVAFAPSGAYGDYRSTYADTVAGMQGGANMGDMRMLLERQRQAEEAYRNSWR